MQIGYADVTADGLVVTTTDGSQPVTLGSEGKIIDGEVSGSATDGGIERGLNFGRAFSCDAEGLAAAGGAGDEGDAGSRDVQAIRRGRR